MAVMLQSDSTVQCTDCTTDFSWFIDPLLLYNCVCVCVCRPSPASVWVCSHRGTAALYPPPTPLLPQEAAAPHEDDVPHQPERGHAPPPPRYRHSNTGEAQKKRWTNHQLQNEASSKSASCIKLVKLKIHILPPKQQYIQSQKWDIQGHAPQSEVIRTECSHL